MITRFRELDGLRGLAALAVVVSHFTGAYNSRHPGDPQPAFDFPQGAFGVQLFFLISGFVILMSAAKAKKPSDFVISRVSRIYPAYWLSLILALISARIFHESNLNLAIWEELANFSMMQRWVQIPNVVDVFWTLAVELQFYVLILALLVLTRCRISDRLIGGVTMAWLVLSLGVAVWAGPFSRGIDPQSVVTPVKVVLNISLAEYGPLFCCGMLAYLSRRDGKARPMMFVSGVVAVAASALLHSWSYGAIVAGICAGFILIALLRRTPWLNLRPLQLFGKISYSLYIVHATVGYIVIQLTLPIVGRDAAMLLAFGASVLMAWGVYLLGEKYGSAAFKLLLVRMRDGNLRSKTVKRKTATEDGVFGFKSSGETKRESERLSSSGDFPASK